MLNLLTLCSSVDKNLYIENIVVVRQNFTPDTSSAQTGSPFITTLTFILCPEVEVLKGLHCLVIAFSVILRSEVTFNLVGVYWGPTTSDSFRCFSYWPFKVSATGGFSRLI